MFVSVHNQLPTTSYVKMIDTWLLGSLLFPFLEVLIHTYMDLLRIDHEKEGNHERSTRKTCKQDGEDMVRIDSGNDADYKHQETTGNVMSQGK